VRHFGLSLLALCFRFAPAQELKHAAPSRARHFDLLGMKKTIITTISRI
jgi:hypothetical protein